MDRSTFRKPGGARPDVSQCKKLGNRTRVSKETCRGESEAPQGKLTNLGGTKMEQLVNSVKDKLRSEMNDRLEDMLKHLQFLKQRLSTSVPYRGESEASHGKLTYLDGTKMEQLVKCVEDNLRSEMNALYEGMVTHLQFLKESLRGESEAPQGKLTNLGGTKIEQFVKSVEDKLRSEMNALYEGMVTHLQFLKQRLRGESEAPQGKLTNLGGTKIEQFVKSVEDKLRSEMNDRLEDMLKHLQFLKQRLSTSVPYRGESEASHGKLTYLDGTKMEQLVKSVEDNLRSEMNALYEGMVTHLQVLEESLRGESEAPQGKLTNLGGTKIEQFVKSVEDKLRSEMNDRLEDMLKHLQFLKQRLSTSVPYRGESEASHGKLTYLDGTKMEQLVKSVEDNLRSEMNALYEGMVTHLQFLEESLRGESEAPTGKLTNLGGTKIEQFVKSVEDKLRSEMNALYEGMVTHLQFLKESLRGESEAPQGKLTNLGGTKIEQFVKSVEDKLRSEMNDRLEDMLKHLQFLKQRLRGESEASQGKLTYLDGTNMEQLVKSVEDNLRSEMNALYEGMVTHLQFLEESLSQEAGSRIDSCCSRSQKATSKSQCFAQKELPKMVSAEEFHQKEEECEKLKEQKRVLEQNPRLELVSASAVGSHKFSENLNDPCRLSVVLEMYDRLRIHEWEKAKCAASVFTFPMTYEKGSTIIKAVFSICEEDLSQRLEQIFELLEIPVSKKTTSLFDSQQLPPGLAREIKNHLKNLYFNYGEDFYQAKSRPALAPDQQRFQPLVKFTAECYKIYCLLLLQNLPIKAAWSTSRRIPTASIEHVDNKVIESCISINFLWPMLTCEEQLIRKGVIYD
ncbi:titin homolog isoform X1 [Mauremys mutica]|uniref:titin homolog isoform X1 n=1 Tax=Mauremys mutica TaxID=74926 RepID=UPI001D136771|nr:titin homolog isoform X1 [Mauremys mutica]